MSDHIDGSLGVDEPRRGGRTYSRPELVRYPLRPEEAVLGACKSSTSAGPAAADCGVGIAPCSSIGS